MNVSKIECKSQVFKRNENIGDNEFAILLKHIVLRYVVSRLYILMEVSLYQTLLFLKITIMLGHSN